jgi:hypothetical protein
MSNQFQIVPISNLGNHKNTRIPIVVMTLRSSDLLRQLTLTFCNLLLDGTLITVVFREFNIDQLHIISGFDESM